MDTIDDCSCSIIDNNDTTIAPSSSQSLSLASELLDFNISSAITRDKINVDYTLDSSSQLPPSKSIEESISSESLNDINKNTVDTANTTNTTNDDNNGIAEEKVDMQEAKKVLVTIGPQHFDLLKVIGEGAFGKVILVRNILDNRKYAMKVLSKKLLKKTNNIAYMKSERDILTKIEHPFVVQLWYAFQTESKLFLVMDFLNGGELFFHLKRRGLISENEARFYLAEMILAIEFLHSNGVIHRDLKPENVLLNGDGHVVLTDFGLAKEIGSSEKVRTLCGTSEYMAPEMLARNGYGKSVDWWSLGALFFEMLTGKPPFSAKNQSNKDLEKKIMTEKFVAPSFLTANAHALLKGMLEKDSNKRLGSSKSTMFSIGGVSALKSHVFFEGLNWVALGRLEIEPPFDISVNQDSARNIESTEDALTMHFHEGFTTMHISHSFIEDTLSNVSSPTLGRSRAGSVDNNYDGFEYFGGEMEFTVEEVEKADAFIQQKIIKVNKKKSLKAKKEEEQHKKFAVEEALRLEKLAKEEQELKIKLQQQREETERQEELNRIAKLREENIEKLKLRNQYQEKIDEYLESNNKVQKKLKALKKKLRDILDLQIKKDSNPDLKLSSEQKDKLKKKGSVEQEIADVEKELEILGAQEPPPIPSDLFDIDMDLINSPPLPNLSATIASNTNAETRSEAAATKPAATKPAATKPAATKPAATIPAAVAVQDKDDDKSKVKDVKPITPNPNQKDIKVEEKSTLDDEEFTVVATSKKNRKR